MSEAPHFPRGSVQTGKASEGGTKRSLTNDSLFGAKKRVKIVDVSNKNSKKPKVTSGTLPSVGLGLAAVGSNESKPIYKIHPLSSARFTTNSFVFAYVLHIGPSYVVVSLPGGLTGTIELKEISDVVHNICANASNEKNEVLVPEISKLLHLYQPLRCCILGNGNDAHSKTSKIQLSSRSSLINKALSLKVLYNGLSIGACVASKEDHGYVIHCGMSGVSVFLPKMDTNNVELEIGQPIECVIKEINEESRTVIVRLNTNGAFELPVENKLFPFLALSPGMLFKVSVEKKLDNGLIVSYLDVFRAVIDIHSLQEVVTAEEWKNKEFEKLNLYARIVFIDHGTKSVRMSLKPHILKLRVPDLPKIGDILENMSIINTSFKKGLVLRHELPCLVDSSKNDTKTKKEAKFALLNVPSEKYLEVIIPKRSLAKTEESESSKNDNNIGSVINGKVMGYHLIEGSLVVSNRKEIMDASVFHYTHMMVGQIHNVEIKSIRDFGLVVEIGGKITAICPLIHTSDIVAGIKLNKKFSIGQKLKMKVWEVEGNSIVMTNKKSLIELNESKMINSYETANVGCTTVGIVSKSTSDGILVNFFNRVKGFVPSNVLLFQGISDISEAFRIGQVVKVVVLGKSLNKKQGKVFHRITLGLDINCSPETLSTLFELTKSNSSASDSSRKTSGSYNFVNGIVNKVNEEGIFVNLDDGRSAILDFQHLYDFSLTSESISKYNAIPYKVGDKINNALILDEDKSPVILSFKPLLTHVGMNMNKRTENETDATEQIPHSINDLTPGLILAGYIVKVESYGVLVRFRNGFTALAPRPSLSDRFISSPIGIFQVGDSIRCVVQRVDLSKNRAFVTFKPSVVPPSGGKSNYLLSIMKEKYLIAEACLAMENKQIPAWKSYPLGSIINGTVSSKESFGTVLLADDKVTMLLCKGNSTSANIGDILQIKVIDLDFSHGLLEVVTVPARSSKKKKTYAVGELVDVSILSVSPLYCIASNDDILGYISLADYHNPKPEVDVKIGDRKTVKLLQIGVPKKAKYALFPHENITLFCFENSSSRQIVTTTGKDCDESSNQLVRSNNKEHIHFKVGITNLWEIEGIEEHQLTVKAIGSSSTKVKVCATVHVTQLPNNVDDKLSSTLEECESIQSNKNRALHPLHPFNKYSIGDRISCQTIKIWKGKNVKQEKNEISEDLEEGHSDCYFIQLRLIDSAQENSDHVLLETHGKGAINISTICNGIISRIHTHSVTVALSPFLSAELSFLDVSADPSTVIRFQKFCFVGMRITVAVLDIVKDNNRIQNIKVSRLPIEYISRNTNEWSSDCKSIENIAKFSEADYEEGQQVCGIVDLKYPKTPGFPAVIVHLRNGQIGRICITELEDKENWVDLKHVFSLLKNQSSTLDEKQLKSLVLPGGLHHGSIATCVILSVKENYLEVSLRPNRLGMKDSIVAAKPDPSPLEGSVISAFVTNTTPKGCFLRVSNSINGRVLLKDLSDKYVEHPELKFETGMLVTGKVVSVDHLLGAVQLSLKSSVVVGNLKAKEEIENLHQGDVVEGIVERVNDTGVFIKINGTSLVGLSRKAMALDNPNDILQQIFSVGDTVKAKVLRVSSMTMKIALGLKNIYFSDNFVVSDFNENQSQTNALLTDNVGDNDIGEVATKQIQEKKRERENNSLLGLAKKQKQSESNHALKAVLEDEEGVSFQWNSAKNDKCDDDAIKGHNSDDDETLDNPSDSRRRKQKDTRNFEQNIRDRERSLADGKLLPETADDFERLLIAQPNSSFLWVQYIAFYLKQVDVEAARTIANRALRTIHFREEEEKYNIWVALLNLEYKFGSKESLERIFSQSINENKTKRLFLALASIYEQANDKKAAEDLFLRALKRPQLKKSKKVWIAYHQFKLRAGDEKGAKAELSRSLQSLSKHKHVEVISRFAFSEYEFGFVDHGRVLFEELLNTYPKRTDLWHLYVDKEIKLGNTSQVRQIFDRMINSKANSRNMKVAFKKYLTFETQFGDQTTEERVKQLAREYVMSLGEKAA